MAKPKPSERVLARRYFISGRVQGVGFRYFAERVATTLGIAGYARNLEDGRVEVYAIGTPEKLNELSGYLWKGPRSAQVRSLEEAEAGLMDFTEFHIEFFG